MHPWSDSLLASPLPLRRASRPALVLLMLLLSALAASAQVPAAPAGLAATANSSGTAQVLLTWNASSGAVSYNVNRATVSGGPYTTVSTSGSVTGTSYTDSTGLTNAPYFYRVVAVNGNGLSANSVQVSATPGTPLLPAPPLRAVATATGVNASWVATGAANYNVYRGTSSSSGPLAYVAQTHNTFYNDTGLTVGTTYYYQVYPVSADGQGAGSNVASAVPGSTALPAPTGLTAAPGNAQVGLSWNAVSGATSYDLFRGTSPSGLTFCLTGLAGTTYTDTGLNNGATYYYYICAVNAAGEGGHSNEPSATPVLPVPSTPTGLTATAGAQSVALAWTASAAAATYSLYRGTSPGGEVTSPVQTGITGTSVTDLSLTAGTTYYYTVAAANAAGQSGPSNEASATPPTAAPAAPVGLSATANPQAVTLAWSVAASTPGTAPASFNVKRGPAAGPFATVATVGASATSYTDTTATGVTTYYYYVTAANAAGESAGSNQASATPGSAALAAPVLRASATGTGVSLYWGAVPSATSYNLYRGLSASALSLYHTGILNAFYQDTNLTVGTTYYYQVAAVDADGQGACGNTVAVSDASATPGSTPLPAPANLVATTASGQVTLSWGAVTGATSYNLFRGTSSSDLGSAPIQNGITGTTVTDSGVTPGQTYYYYVCAVDVDGEGAHSNRVSATPGGTPPSAPPGLRAVAGSTGVNLYWGAVPNATGYTLYRGTTQTNLAVYQAGLTATSYTDAGLSSGATYFYQVATTSLNGQGLGGNVVSATVGASRLAAPAGLTATAGNAQVGLTWGAVSGAASYDLFRSTSAGGEGNGPIKSVISGTSYTDTTVMNGTPYYYKVAAVSAGSGGNQSSEASATPQPPAPGVPTGLTATGVNGAVSLAWTASSNAVSYSVKRGTASGGPYSTISTAGTVTGTAYTDSTISGGATYYYVVSAVNTAAESGSSNQASAAAVVPTAVVVSPATASVVAGGTKSFSASVRDQNGNALSPQPSVAWGVSGGGTIDGASGLFTAGSTTGGPYTITATFGSLQGTASVTVSTVPAPTGLTAAAGAGQVSLSWNAVSGATSYGVYRGGSAGAEGATPFYTTTGTGCVDAGLVGGSAYYYVVKATGPGGESAASNEAHATPSNGSGSTGLPLRVTDVSLPKAITLAYPPSGVNGTSTDPVTGVITTVSENAVAQRSLTAPAPVPPGRAYYGSDAVGQDGVIVDHFDFDSGTTYYYRIFEHVQIAYTVPPSYTGPTLVDSDGYYYKGTILVTPYDCAVTDNQSVDARYDPRYSAWTYLDHNFGATAYRGGLSVGYNSDNSEVGHAYLKWALPAAPGGQTPWPGVGSVWACYLRSYASGSTNVTCRSVLPSWDGATIVWSSAPTFNPAATGAPYVTVTYDDAHPAAPAWERWNLPTDITTAVANGGAFAVGLGGKSEPSTASDPIGGAATGWAYFAKKEYAAADAAVVLYAYGASL